MNVLADPAGRNPLKPVYVVIMPEVMVAVPYATVT
jgi:hypothetical protein